MGIKEFEQYQLEDFIKNRLTEEGIEFVKYISPNRFTTVFSIHNWNNDIILSKHHFEIWSGTKVVNSIHYGSMEDIFRVMSMIVFLMNK